MIQEIYYTKGQLLPQGIEMMNLKRKEIKFTNSKNMGDLICKNLKLLLENHECKLLIVETENIEVENIGNECMTVLEL